MPRPNPSRLPTGHKPAYYAQLAGQLLAELDSIFYRLQHDPRVLRGFSPDGEATALGYVGQAYRTLQALYVVWWWATKVAPDVAVRRSFRMGTSAIGNVTHGLTDAGEQQKRAATKVQLVERRVAQVAADRARPEIAGVVMRRWGRLQGRLGQALKDYAHVILGHVHRQQAAASQGTWAQTLSATSSFATRDQLGFMIYDLGKIADALGQPGMRAAFAEAFGRVDTFRGELGRFRALTEAE